MFDYLPMLRVLSPQENLHQALVVSPIGSEKAIQKKLRRKETLREGDVIHLAAGAVPHPGIQAASHIIGE